MASNSHRKAKGVDNGCEHSHLVSINPVKAFAYSLQATETSGSWPVFAAASLTVSFPVLVIFFLSQKHMVSGLTSGGVKG